MKKISLVAVVLLAVACGGVNKTTQSPEAKASETKPVVTSEKTGEVKDDPNQNSQRVGKNMTRLVVSFYSTGSGSDSKSIDMFDSFLMGYELPGKNRVAYDKIPWGREGEVDFCMGLENLDSQSQSNFMITVREILMPAQHVHIAENAPCNHKP